MAEVRFGRGPARTDELLRQRELVEKLVPGLGLPVGGEEAHSYAQVGRLEEDEPVDEVGVGAREALGPDGPKVVRDEAYPVQTEMLH